jgi:hypothetical protein
MLACWLPATVLLIANVGIATSYLQLRANDFAMAHQIASKLSDQGFPWDKPIVVDAGSWQHMARFSSGTIGDMVSLLQPWWSGPYLLGLVARKRILLPSAEQWRTGAAECERIRPKIIQFEISVQSEYALVCL